MGVHQPVTNPGTDQAQFDLGSDRLVYYLSNPRVQEKILRIVRPELGLQVQNAEQRLGARLNSVVLAMKSNMANAVGNAVINFGSVGRQAASRVAGYPPTFKLALVAVFALFCAVCWLCVEHVRGVSVRAQQRVAMEGLLDEARATVAQTDELRADITSNTEAVQHLLEATGRNTEFRQSYEAYNFPAQIDDVREELGALQLEIAALHQNVANARRDMRQVAHRVAPIEAVTLTNRTRYYRGPLDDLAGSTRCVEASLRYRRNVPDWHVRTCTDGFNGEEYLLWCAQEFKRKPLEERYSGCTSTNPVHQS